MKAAILQTYDGPLTIAETPDPECPVDGALIDVRACGVCRSDHHAWKGVDPDIALPHIMGHEFAGVVLETGPECRGFTPGDRVTAPFILGCGHCADCRAGQPTVCNRQEVIGFTYSGAFAERLAIPRADFNLVRLPENLEFADAAGMGCRITTAWRALADRGALAPGEWVAVHGAGGVGLSAVMIAAVLGARVLAVDISKDALVKATTLGANAVLNASEVTDVGEAVREITGGGAHVSVEALGIASTFTNSLKSLRKLGRHVQVGMPVGPHETVPLPLLDLIYARQLTIHGMRGLGAAGFTSLFDMVQSGRLNLDGLVTQRIALSEAGAALRAMDGGQPAGVTVITDFTR